MKALWFYISILLLTVFISCEELGLTDEDTEEMVNSITVTFSGTAYDVVTDQPLENVNVIIGNSTPVTTNVSGDYIKELTFKSEADLLNTLIRTEKKNYQQVKDQVWIWNRVDKVAFDIAMEQVRFVSILADSIDFGLFEVNQTFKIINDTETPVTYSLRSADTFLSISPNSGTVSNDRPNNNNLIVISLDRSIFTNGQVTTTLDIQIDGELFKSIIVQFSNPNPDNLHWVDEDEDRFIDIRNIDDLYRLSLEHDRDTFDSFVGFELIKNLDFNDANDYRDANLMNELTKGEGWVPIGLKQNKSFEKIFEGHDFIINNLKLDRATEYNGLFAYTSSSAKIRNLRLENLLLSGHTYSGGLVGWNRAEINNCSVQGNINASSGAVGLLIGRHVEGEVNFCFAEGSVQSTGNSIGGLIGNLGERANDSIKIQNSYAAVSVRGNDNLGGLIGNRNSGVVEINSCFATGDLVAQGERIGGLIGSFVGSLSNCYATGNTTSNDRYVAGFIGYNTGVLTSCYSLGEPKGSSLFGGLIGFNSGSVTNTNYWDIETSGLAISAAGLGYNTSILQGVTADISIYLTWDEDIWDFGTSSEYPVLKNMPGGIEKQRE